MTRYDDDRVVTLLREVDLPAAPPDRMAQVGRRARARESRLMGGLAGVLTLVLVGGGLGVASLRGDGAGTQALTVAAVARSTTQAGTARVTIRLHFSGMEAVLPAGAAAPKDAHLSGVVDFVHDRFLLRGTLTGEPMEQRGIGTDRWDRSGAGTWQHSTASAGEVGQIDPGLLLERLTSGGRTLSTRRDGDRTVFRIRVPARLLGGEKGEPGTIDLTVVADADGRVRSLAFTEGHPASGTVTITMTYDDFGVPVDVRPPPADQVVEQNASGSSGGVTFGGTGTATPEQACALLQQLEAQVASTSDEQQKRVFGQMIAELRKQCAKK